MNSLYHKASLHLIKQNGSMTIFYVNFLAMMFRKPSLRPCQNELHQCSPILSINFKIFLIFNSFKPYDYDRDIYLIHGVIV